jgi:uncharacterized protein (DUF362 family)
MIKAQEYRHGGCPAKLNTMIAGTDPVSLDLFGMQLLKQLEPKFEDKKNRALKYIEYASNIGLGKKDFAVKKIDDGVYD